MAVLGRIMPLPKGLYDSATVYDMLDMVTYNNRLWICKKANTVNIAPTEENTTYWQLAIINEAEIAIDRITEAEIDGLESAT